MSIHPDWDNWLTSRQEFVDRFPEPSSFREEPWLWGEQSALLADAGAIAEKMAEQIRVHSPAEPGSTASLAASLLDVAAKSIRGAEQLLIEP